ncbi:hypothetical protein PF004_g32216 [Phytophthora fragariae]|uniref:Peptidase A2 domain-containing protein n=1 Tax=Phytophthora fragariae TaxID=53985 RepID=A0A6A3I9H2_9STRA|nr:hypothetical protein PF011_g23951 [Phytophthora fragariae]KAE9157449.1 hypothetical protein PF004_g32216 [Phytophthora fragariae]
MRALVKGAVDDTRIRILLDTGANVSVISASFAKKLRVREVFDHGRSLEVRGINPGIMETQRRALVKVTLGWKHAYEFEVWIMDHSAGVDVVLGMDFMVPAGIRLDLFHASATSVASLSSHSSDLPSGGQEVSFRIPRDPAPAPLVEDTLAHYTYLAQHLPRKRCSTEASPG